MPIILPEKLIDPSILEENNIFTMSPDRAASQDIRPLKVAIVNLMPAKEETEVQLVKMLANTALQIQIDFLTTASYQSRHAEQERLDSLYKTFEEIRGQKYDAMIITGAPVEALDYQDILYWDELREILDYARENVYSTLFICWAAQAALHHYYGVEARLAEKKIFGVFEFEKKGHAKVLKGFDDVFAQPHSRHTYVAEEDLLGLEDLVVLAGRPDTGVALAASKDNRLLFNFGHWEYDKGTLDKEYRRDLEKGLADDLPTNYYRNEDPDQGIRVSWRSAGNLFFSNWLNYCVYQETPFSVDQIKAKSVAKFGGSSLADADHFARVKHIVQSDQDRRVVIVSAPGKRRKEDIKLTDRLIHDYELKRDREDIRRVIDRLQRVLAEYDKETRENAKEIADRFRDIVDQLGLGTQVRAGLDKDLDDLASAQDRDYIVSRGEYINAKIMSAFLGYKLVDAKDLIRVGPDGRVDLEETRRLIRDKIGEKDRVVVPGFYGADSYGKIVTFPRGGSDFTGSLLASALDSAVYENWTDVDGVMTADPQKDRTARKIPRLSYEELSEIIDRGAAIYQREAIDPVREKNIVLRFLNTNNATGTGTEVRD
ncbi:MAG: homoserine O-succinyltransferase [Firmicutes bacterium]|nr:homoserine O-succinyltransferase [Bacillota bacterium]